MKERKCKVCGRAIVTQHHGGWHRNSKYFGGRERETCSDRCRQIASRERRRSR